LARLYILRNKLKICLFIFSCIFLSLKPSGPVFSSPITVGTIDRSQEMLRRDDKFREETEVEKNYFVEKIIVKGAYLIPKSEIQKITSPFENQRVSEEDARKLAASLEEACLKENPSYGQVKVNYKFRKNGVLVFSFDESTP